MYIVLLGWDIRKALNLLHQMNPSICEWLYSPIIYYTNLELDFQKLAKEALLSQNRILPLLYHYKSMAKSNFKAHIDGKENVNIKKYLYVIRPAGMFIWLINKNENKLVNFEIDFSVILNEIKDSMSQECNKNVEEIIEKKKQLNESDLKPRIACVDEWINGVLSDKYTDALKKIEKEGCYDKQISLELLDRLFFKVLNV
jgi:predicted nucleotidyltransferase